MRNRWNAVLATLVAAPLLMGSGGFNPPIEGSVIVGPAVKATFVVDPHNNGLKEGQASIRLDYKKRTTGAVFTIPTTDYFAQFGCDLSKMEARFHNQLLTTWVPEAIVTQLFADLGLPVVPGGAPDPVITDTDSAVCTPDPENMAASPNPGTLSFDAIIQFAVPGRK